MTWGKESWLTPRKYKGQAQPEVHLVKTLTNFQKAVRVRSILHPISWKIKRLGRVFKKLPPLWAAERMAQKIHTIFEEPLNIWEKVVWYICHFPSYPGYFQMQIPCWSLNYLPGKEVKTTYQKKESTFLRENATHFPSLNPLGQSLNFGTFENQDLVCAVGDLI